MLNIRRGLLAFIALAAGLILACCAAIGARTAAYAAGPVGGEDGVYSVPVDLGGLAMGADNFSQTATVEKSGNAYYFTFGHSSGIANMTLNIGGKKAGYTVKSEEGRTYYTYTLSETNVQSDLPFTAYITAMKREVSFTVSLNLSSAARTGDYSYEGERPAEFVPVLTTDAGNEYEMKYGSVFPVPSASAYLGAEECEVTVTAYYGGAQVAIADNCFTLGNVGEYRLVYRASSPSYKTSLGNDTYTEYEVKIVSSVGGSEIAKFEDLSGTLPEGTAIMPSRLSDGSAVYGQAAEKMKTIADNFEVFGIKLISADGSEVEPSGNIALYLQLDGTYDRTKVVVYLLDGSGNLTKLNSGGYGRYVRVETDRTGTFIVCIPGVAFVMPMWGYAVILAACVVVLAAAVTVTVILVRKKRKAQNSQTK